MGMLYSPAMVQRLSQILNYNYKGKNMKQNKVVKLSDYGELLKYGDLLDVEKLHTQITDMKNKGFNKVRLDLDYNSDDETYTIDWVALSMRLETDEEERQREQEAEQRRSEIARRLKEKAEKKRSEGVKAIEKLADAYSINVTIQHE